MARGISGLLSEQQRIPGQSAGVEKTVETGKCLLCQTQSLVLQNLNKVDTLKQNYQIIEACL